MTESDIISGLKDNKQEVFRYFVEQNHVRIFRVCMGLLQNKEDAEEIAQDVFIEVYRSIRNFKGKSSLSTWLYRIAVNKSLNLIKKKKINKWLVYMDTFFPQEDRKIEVNVNNNDGPDSKMERKEMDKLMNKVLSQLTENQRIAFTLHKYEDLSHKEIAEIMSTSVSAVESLIFRAKDRIRKNYSHLIKD